MKNLFAVLLSFACIGISTAQNVSLTGTVRDNKGETIIGANIMIKNSTVGTITDLDGDFMLDAPSDATLIISYIGYVTQEIPLKGRKNVVVTLLEDTKSLEEVVVVGYGIQKKVNLTGSVSSVEGDQIAARPASNAVAALQGQMPGVTITRTGGQPGSETSGMQIRGAASVNSTSTLVLIDGIEGDLTLVNPNDIESISVLKDAASCAIYGARAAAGVVLVTTKSGKEGKPVVTYNGYYAFNTPGNMPERLPAWEEQYFIDQSRIPTTGKPEWTEEKASW